MVWEHTHLVRKTHIVSRVKRKSMVLVMITAFLSLYLPREICTILYTLLIREEFCPIILVRVALKIILRLQFCGSPVKSGELNLFEDRCQSVHLDGLDSIFILSV